MRNLLTQFRPFTVAFLLSCGGTVGWTATVQAATPETAPPELKVMLNGIEQAANQENLDQILGFYSPSYRNSDDISRDRLAEALQQFWNEYDNVTYRTELRSWEQQGDRIITETSTYVTGTQVRENQQVTLEAMLRSRQVLQNNQIVDQEILAEESKLFWGDNPPEVRVNLPERVRPGQKYYFDAIVTEPLGNNLLLGTALEQDINGDRFFEANELEFDLLQAGGLFKQGTAPDSEKDIWLSAIVVRNDGVTTVTRRLRVER
ncbi:MAG: nuclear transport factor 2 family protein [Jaaginema sp. PMC 1079.18]|nr:nuclear transport factor 2 family protein [Jaaginema sp. PMC 1080.18]MEC4851891.1 nuclear transport factor 2 family protein [Jaaginema sp. PMC 1079.18]MEC4866475.1 nuclear transport factor 2 family protein [Jaaginema sp. PMC 1078.18]